ncbi:MAG: polysaccharide deacetylase family protein [Gammaproteobacteria bacterium]|nr:polysaccharide deacetylase family protein [Gammaproteobacteria bacterium]
MRKILPTNSDYLFICVLIWLSLLVSGCAGITISHSTALDGNTKFPKLTFAKNDEFVVLVTQSGDTLESLAEKYLHDKSKTWIIADFNEITKIVPNREIVIPLKPQNNIGVTVDGIQTIPILCYHRFGSGHAKLAVSEKNFQQQMQYLKDNNYNVIPINDVYDFLRNKKPLPKKSVVITIDDGYKSTYDTAFPILKSFNFPATLFLYTDFTGARDAINWKQAKLMNDSGLIDIQPHSKTHPNMSLKKDNESDTEYLKRMSEEIENPGNKIKSHLKYDMQTFAYPYGDTNANIIDILKTNKYKLGVTVQPGTNTAFAHPYMLQRTMIFGDHSMKDFTKALVVFKNKKLK